VNEGAPSQPLGLRFEVGAERTTITRPPLGAASELSGELPLRSRMAAALRSGPLTYGALADQLAVSYDMVKKVANEGRDRTFTILEPEAGTWAKRVALLSDRTPYSLSSEIAAAPIAVSLVVVRKPYFSTSTGR
jgi:hypothetical protein